MQRIEFLRTLVLAGLLAAAAIAGGCSTVTPPPSVALPEPPPEPPAVIIEPAPPAPAPTEPREGPPDAVPKLERLAAFANRNYVMRGRRYQPMTRLEPFRERGVASWYGVPFHGRRTAIGDRYDMNQMTAAHPTLPLPCYAKVRNVRNGRTAIVRVNDRGPYADGRIIDLSRAAARRLGIVEHGTAAVELELIVLEPAGAPLAANFETEPIRSR